MQDKWMYDYRTELLVTLKSISWCGSILQNSIIVPKYLYQFSEGKLYWWDYSSTLMSMIPASLSWTISFPSDIRISMPDSIPYTLMSVIPTSTSWTIPFPSALRISMPNTIPCKFTLNPSYESVATSSSWIISTCNMVKVCQDKKKWMYNILNSINTNMIRFWVGMNC